MAEITTNSKKTTRVDMTPMVDLGFLLITFFVFTTTFTKPFVLKLAMPDNKTDGHQDMKSKNTLTLILGKDNRLFWHQEAARDLKVQFLKETNYSGNGVRNLILESRKNAPKPANFTVIIKPTDESNYKNTVDILDEMLITSNTSYAIVDLLPNEKNVYLEKVKL